ncbi:MAG: hypothetical protein DHS20C21_17070 [Gemmatimonadota bacterium]|nr:MAG: hypothetical protein DHS20C21_17070 [Gemmatimonadota bacterium]
MGRGLWKYAARGVLLVLVIGLGGWLVSRSPWRQETTDTNPMLLIGLDGMEWDVAFPLLRAGQLPNLQRLMESGVAGELISMKPTGSPIIWTTIATGVGRDEHGITGFTKKTLTRRSNLELFTSRDRLVKALWNILSDADRVVTVIGWWNTYPAESVNGVVVAQVNTIRSDGTLPWDMRKGALFEDTDYQVFPPQLQEEFLAHIPKAESDLSGIARAILGEDPLAMDPMEAKLWANCEWALRADATYHRVALDCLSRNLGFDLFAVYYGATDVAGHRFWRYYEPSKYEDVPSEANIANLGRIIPAYYAYIDARIGELLAAAPENCNVLVVSDHGMVASGTEKVFSPDRPVSKLNSGDHADAPSAVFVAAGPDIRRSGNWGPVEEWTREQLREVGSVYDITPTILAMQGIPLGEDMVGTVMESILAPGFLETHPVQWIASHTPSGWWEARQSGDLQPHLSEEREEQLRSLGYIE